MVEQQVVQTCPETANLWSCDCLTKFSATRKARTLWKVWHCICSGQSSWKVVTHLEKYAYCIICELKPRFNTVTKRVVYHILCRSSLSVVQIMCSLLLLLPAKTRKCMSINLIWWATSKTTTEFWFLSTPRTYSFWGFYCCETSKIAFCHTSGTRFGKTCTVSAEHLHWMRLPAETLEPVTRSRQRKTNPCHPLFSSLSVFVKTFLGVGTWCGPEF